MAQQTVSPAGLANIPVILITFSDRTQTYTLSDFNDLLFGTGLDSMKDYYEEVSYGAFSISSGPMGLDGWYTAPKRHDYYGAVNGAKKDAYPGDLVRYAVYAADYWGFNFAPYDQDGDCYVDVVNVVHQGTGQEYSGISTDIWSHRHSLNAAYSTGQSHEREYTTNDPCPAGGYIKVNDYVIQPEQLDAGNMITIGVFTHEYAHALGLPDLYDTDGSSNGIGDWSLMAGGVWNNRSGGISGDTPAHLDAWSKYFLGWLQPTQVTGLLNNELILSVEDNQDIYKILDGTPLSGEYFLIENRQQIGFDEGLPSSGLLIWHIDGNIINAKRTANTVNTNECYPGGPSCTINHFGLRLLQADNLWSLEKKQNEGDSGDPYPGNFGNISVTRSSLPNSNLYSGRQSNVSITNISPSGAGMTATLRLINAPPIAMTATPSTWSNVNSFSIDWTNPAESSGIAGAYYKLGTPPASNADYDGYTTSKPFNVSAAAQGGQTIYVWLKDDQDNTSYENSASTILYYDAIAPSNGKIKATAGNAQITLSWSGITDTGGSGLKSSDTFKVVRDTGTFPGAQCTDGDQVYLGAGASVIIPIC
jgi:M6 family metalloprotease-like protein